MKFNQHMSNNSMVLSFF